MPFKKGHTINKGRISEKRGIPRSLETIAKIKATLTGHKHSKETKTKISIGNTGKKLSKETKTKISIARMGKKLSNNTKLKMSLAQTGRKVSDITKEKLKLASTGNKNMLGRHLSQKTKDKISLANSGENHFNWKGGISSIRIQIGNSIEYKQWRLQVYRRDIFTCVDCGKAGGVLHAHHIKFFAELLQEAKEMFPLLSLYDAAMLYKPLWDTNNGVTYCKKCHEEFHKQYDRVSREIYIYKIKGREGNEMTGEIKISDSDWRRDEGKQTWGWFQGHYVAWRTARINKLISILGKDWLKGKTVLECGCGLGHVGEELMKKHGAIVTFAEGREIYANEIRKRLPNVEVIVLDQDTDWNLNRKFDLIIHWGLSYHLNNWRRDLTNTVKHADTICFETVVLDAAEEKEIKVAEGGHHHGAMHYAENSKECYRGTRASVVLIENHLKSLGVTFKRYDDKDLNVEYFLYDWKETHDGKHGDNIRRFWMIYNNKI